MYKTSILVFKDRDKYVSGEYRYRHGYCRSNPRKMVKVSKIIPYPTAVDIATNRNSRWWTIVGLFTGGDPARASDQDVLKTSRVELGWTRVFVNLTGRIGSGQVAFKSHVSGLGGSP